MHNYDHNNMHKMIIITCIIMFIIISSLLKPFNKDVCITTYLGIRTRSLGNLVVGSSCNDGWWYRMCTTLHEEVAYTTRNLCSVGILFCMNFFFNFDVLEHLPCPLKQSYVYCMYLGWPSLNSEKGFKTIYY